MNPYHVSSKGWIFGGQGNEMTEKRITRSFAPHSDTPDGWGHQNEFSIYLDRCRSNQYANFDNIPILVSAYNEIDKLFMLSFRHLKTKVSFETSSLFVRSYSAFKSGALLLSSGALSESLAIIRLMLECAGYAIVMRGNPQATAAWMTNTVPKNRGNPFSIAEIKAKIAQFDAVSSDLYEKIYKESLNLGAHPNSPMVMNASSGDRQKEFRQAVLSGPSEFYVYVLLLYFQAATIALRCVYFAYQTDLSKLALIPRLQKYGAKYGIPLDQVMTPADFPSIKTEWQNAAQWRQSDFGRDSKPGHP